MRGRQVADEIKVSNEPCREISRKGEFEQDGEDGCGEEGGGDCSPRVCEDRAISKAAFSSGGWVVGWGNGSEEDEGYGVGGNEGECCEDERCGADGVEGVEEEIMRCGD